MAKKTNKYTSAGMQNDCLKEMAFYIVRQIFRDVARNGFYTIMADECTDVSNKEQFTIGLRWDEDLVDHEDVLGLYKVDAIDAGSLVNAIDDVLIKRANLSYSQCRGQCYDDASNMLRSRNGVAKQIQAKESHTVLTHCYGHALILQ